MKSLVLKKYIMLLAALITAGTTVSCSVDDEPLDQELPDSLVEQPVQIDGQNKKTSPYHVGDSIMHVDDIVGLVCYNASFDEWYLMYSDPFTIDIVRNYYPSVLDKSLQQEGLRVVFSGDVYMTDIHDAIAGYSSYRIVLTHICELTKDDRVGYWYGATFVECAISDPNRFYVQARATDEPISIAQVQEILTSLGVTQIEPHGPGFTVTAEQRPVHPDLFVSPQLTPVDPRHGSSYTYIHPRISLVLMDGATIDDVVSKYGEHLRDMGRKESEHSTYYSFYCDLSTAEEVLQLATLINFEPTVKWCEATKEIQIIFDQQPSSSSR